MNSAIHKKMETELEAGAYVEAIYSVRIIHMADLREKYQNIKFHVNVANQVQECSWRHRIVLMAHLNQSF